ncbi:MAG: hypothetical protein ACPHAN_05705 [Pseudomonadales bacterium]
MEQNVQMIDGKSAAQVLHDLLGAAVQTFPDAFENVHLPNSLAAFRKQYVDFLPRFEVARLASKDRHAIALHLARAYLSQLVIGDSQPLSRPLDSSTPPLQLRSKAANASPGWTPVLHFLHQDWQSLEALGEHLETLSLTSAPVTEALRWLESNHLSNKTLELQDRNVVVLGAGAEMAPTAQFLDAGANVLWLDLAPPTALIESPHLRGHLSWIEGGADLLRQPAEIAATIIEFAKDKSIDLCLYAYAPGQARELRLTGAMNAIVEALPVSIIASITLLLSPTTATPLEAADVHTMQSRQLRRPTWETLLDKLHLLGRGGGCSTNGTFAASRSLVGIQGASYQAAQYLGKLMMAEAWTTHGQVLQSVSSALRVSANTAPITQTRSVTHPVFDAAFGGAKALGVETLTPLQSQTLNGLLAIHDWLHPKAPVPAALRVHGGIHTLPYPMNTALLVAAAIGFARRPSLLTRLLKS